MEKTLWVVTAGTTDVQALAQRGARSVRVPLGSKVLQQKVLEAIRAGGHGAPKWVPLDQPSAALRQTSDALQLSEAHMDAAELVASAEDALPQVLLAAKVAPLQPSVLSMQGAMVLSTDRPDRQDEREPIAAGPLLAGWLAGLGGDRDAVSAAMAAPFPNDCSPASGTHFVKSHSFFYVNFLVGNETQEANADDAIRRIHAALVAAKGADFSEVVIADTGGLSSFKESIRLCAALVFGTQAVKVTRAVEDRSARQQNAPQATVEWLQQLPACEKLVTPPKAAPQVTPLSVEATAEHEFRVRLSVVELLYRGALDAAEGMAGLAARKGDWVRGVELAAGMVGRGWRNAPKHLPKDYWVKHGKGNLTMPPPAIAAFRVEAALCRGAWAEAIAHTFELGEWADLEFIRRGLEAKLIEHELWRNGTPLVIQGDLWIDDFYVQNRDQFMKLMAAVNADFDESKQKKLFEHREWAEILVPGSDILLLSIKPQHYYYDERKFKHWVNPKVRLAGITSAPRRDNVAHWRKFVMPSKAVPVSEAFSTILNHLPAESGHGPRYYRNAQAHNTLVEGHLNNAADAFIQAQLWSNDVKAAAEKRREARGHLFLSIPQVNALLGAVCNTQDDFSEIYRDWVEKVATNVRQAPF